MSDPRSTPNPYATPVPGTPEAQGQVIGAQRAALPSELGVKPDARLQRAFLTQAFVWMFVGLIVSAGVAFWVQSNENLLAFAANNYFLLIIAQFALVLGIGFGIKKISATAALGLFFVYAASVGLTLGLIVTSYTLQANGDASSVVSAFLSASAVFGAAAIYGATTTRSLTGLGGLLFMGLIGLLVAMVINVFLGSDQLAWILSIVGVIIFTALTAYDVQRIQNGDLAVWTGSMEKAAVLGALNLYLDFLNLFLFFLRLFGGGRN
jgi:FtsH-binding integral membrane protein